MPIKGNPFLKTKRDIEHLNLDIDWSVLTEEEQITLHQLLSKAHQGYCNYESELQNDTNGSDSE